MAYTYKGTRITGTKTTARKFTKSKISNAKKGQTYFNTQKGHVYKCTVKGKPSEAKWKYTRTDIAKKPTTKLKNLGTPSRTTVSGNNHWVKATWKVPKPLTNKKNGKRATAISIIWTLDIPGSKDPKRFVTDGTESHTSAQVNLNSFVANGKTKYNRNSFHPRKSGNYLYGVTCAIAPKNSKGTGKYISAKLKFEKPRAPKISDPAIDPLNGKVSFTITTDAGTDKYERDDTWYKMTVYNSETGVEEIPHNDKTYETSITIDYDRPDYQSVSYGEYIRVRVEAWSRGYAGNTEAEAKEFYYTYPQKPIIEDIIVTGSDTTDNTTAKCTAYINTNTSTEHPTDVVKLQYLADVPYKSAAEIPGSTRPETSDIVDNGDCTALTIPVADILPTKGNHTYLRVLSWHAVENVLFRYSDYMEVTDLFTPAPTAEDDDIDILSAVAGGDGESIVVTLGWNKDGQDDSTGTELSWSEAENTWRSTDDPEAHTFEWSDGRLYALTEDTAIDTGKTYYTRSGEEGAYIYTPVENPVASELDTYYEVTYYDHAEITIKGLDEGTLYYIKARRYMEDDDRTTYSKYSDTVTQMTTETPESIVASCANYLAIGSSLPIYWTFSGNGLQSAWMIKKRVLKDGVYVDDATIAEGTGSMGSAQITSKRLMELAENNTITFNVQASTGSEFVISEDHTVTIIEEPELAITAATPLTVQPLTFSATVNRLCDLKVIVYSKGAVGQFPEGVLRQTSDDTIHSNVYNEVEWVANQDDTWTATVTLPTGLGFWDLGQYTLSVVALDRVTGLQSTERRFDFAIAWAHQAPSLLSTETYSLTADTEVVEDKAYFTYDSETETYTDVMPEGDEDPSAEGWYELSITDYVTLTPIDTVDDNGMHHQAVKIDLIPPPNSDPTDVYDIYRLTGDGAVLIGDNFPLTYSTQDEYAPFGDDMTLEYRVAIRTVDGDVEFSDFEYVLDCDFMRFDWDTGTLELPYNLSIGDKYSKDFEARQHMSGDIDGYWNSAVKRTASLSTDVIRLTMQDEIDAARAMARYTGPVFVRTPDGSAYEADVQVSDLSSEGQIAAIAIDATEIGLTQEYRLPPPHIIDEGQEGTG